MFAPLSLVTAPLRLGARCAELLLGFALRWLAVFGIFPTGYLPKRKFAELGAVVESLHYRGVQRLREAEELRARLAASKAETRWALKKLKAARAELELASEGGLSGGSRTTLGGGTSQDSLVGGGRPPLPPGEPPCAPAGEEGRSIGASWGTPPSASDGPPSGVGDARRRMTRTRDEAGPGESWEVGAGGRGRRGSSRAHDDPLGRRSCAVPSPLAPAPTPHLVGLLPPLAVALAAWSFLYQGEGSAEHHRAFLSMLLPLAWAHTRPLRGGGDPRGPLADTLLAGGSYFLAGFALAERMTYVAGDARVAPELRGTR